MKKTVFSKKRLLLTAAVLIALVLSLLSVTLSAYAADAPSGEVLASYQVSMSGRVNLKFIYSNLGDADAFKAEVYAPGENKPVNTYTYPVDKISSNKTVSVPLAPSEMSYTVKVYPVKLSGNTVVSSGAVRSYSVVEYAKAVMAQRDDYDDTMRALLNWGAFAREFFDKTTEGLSNEGIFTRGTNPQAAVTSVSYPQKDSVQYETDFSNGELNLALNRDDIILSLYFDYSGNETLGATIAREGLSQTATSVRSLGNGRYSVKISNLNVSLFDKVYTIEITAGSSKLKAQVSVLEYLHGMITGLDYSEEQKGTARSLYQFYQLAMKKTEASSCDHGGLDPVKNSDYYYVPADESGSSYYKCSHCFSDLGHGAIGDEVEYYLPAETIKSATATSTATFTLMSDDDGTEYTRINGISGRNVSVNVNLMTSAGDGAVTGKYLVLKLRYGSNGLSQTTLAITANTTPSGTSVTNKVKVSEDNAWHVIVIDLSKGGTLTAGSDGKYHVNSLQITPLVPGGTLSFLTSIKDTHYVDLAYIAMCDDVSDIKGVVKESTYEWSTSSSAYCTRYTSSGICETLSLTTSDGYYVSSCSACGSTVNHGIKTADALRYLPASGLKSQSGSGTFDINVVTEDGITFARYSNFKINNVGWYGITYFGDSKVSGQYLIIKLRVPENGLNSTRFDVYSNTEAEGEYTSALLTAEGQTCLLVSEDNQWQTIVVDLKARSKDPSKTWNDKDEYTLTHFSIRPFADKQSSASAEDYIDIAYMAMCDEISDIPNIIKDDSVYAWSDTATSYVYYNSSDNTLHKCAADPDKTQISTNNDGDKVYRYICEACNNVLYTRTVSSSVELFMDALDNAAHLTGNKLFQGSTTLTVGTGVGVPFAQGSNLQMLWCRSQADMSPGEKSSQSGTFDIGQAKYLAIRVRTDIAGRSFSLSYSTEGSNSPTAVADENTDFTTYKYAIDGSTNELGKTYTTKSNFGRVTFKMNEVAANEWITYIVDLSEILPDQHKKAEGSDSYVVDSFFWTFGEDFASGHIDVDFIAFFENFSELGTLTQESVAYKITAKNGSSLVVDSTSGMCTQNHTEKVISIKNSDGSITYTLGCEKCGIARQDVKPLTVPAGTNYITDLNSMGSYQFNITLEYDSVAGVFYNRFTNETGTDSGHMNFTGGSSSGSATSSVYDPGRYVVIKYRVNGPSGSGINWYVGEYSSGCVGTQYQSAFPQEWTVAVYDMQGNEKWYSGESQLYFQGTSFSGAVTTDIAYIATVDTLDELEALIGHEESYLWCGTEAFGSAGQIKHLDSAYCTDSDNNGKCDDCGGDAVIYGNGGNVTGSGNEFELGEFPLTDREVNESGTIVEKSASELLSILKSKSATEGTVYRVTEPLVLTKDTNYYGKLCHIIAEGGIVIDGVDNVLLKGLVIKGNVTITNSTNITLYNVDLEANGVAINIDAASSGIKIDTSVITADATAISSAAADVTVYESYIAADSAIISSGDGLTVQKNVIEANKVGISSTGEYCIVKNNTLEMNKSGKGIYFGDGSVNGLIALNVVRDAQRSIVVSESFNCAVVLNSAVSISGDNNKNLYVVDNNLGGRITLTGNKYLLADANEFVSDGKDHSVFNKDNSEYNGDNLRDVNARVEYGANEELLPHTNKDLFVGMDRQTSVRDAAYSTTYSFDSYLKNMARSNDVVIVPPGAYVSSYIQLQAEHSNTVIYAYGVYQEKAVSKNEDGTLAFTEDKSTVGSLMGAVFNIDGGKSIHVHGLTIGYDFQSSGQAYVLEKFGGNMVRIIASAGYIEGFATGDLSHFTASFSATHGDEMYPWVNNIAHEFVKLENGEYIGEDGTMVIKITTPDIYSEMQVGDILGCRLAGDNAQTVYLGGEDLLMKDTVVYGYSAALAFVSGGRGSTNVRLERHHNTSRPATLIDEETYNRYKALEVQYGLNADGADAAVEGAQGLEVYIDAEGRYRGGLPRYGSVDATHIMGAEQGVSATSCLFENMVDDASNQRSSSGRVAGYVNNGDGTTTVYLKGSLAKTYYGIDASKGTVSGSPNNSPALAAGDTMFAYAMNGKTFIEAEVLSAGNVTSEPTEVHIVHIDSDRNCICDDDECNAALHYDFKDSTGAVNPDCVCDVCGITVHTDYRTDYGYDGIAPDNENQGIIYYSGDNRCNNAGCELTNQKLMPRLDENGEPELVNGMMVNDADGAPIVTDMASPATLRLHSGGYYVVEYKVLATNGKTKKQYVISYSTPLRMAVVNTSDVNFDAIEGYDLTDNDFFMIEKVLCDNLSLNSAGFTFDNVLMQNYHSRGILAKITDATIKNCTFRNVASTGVLMSIETTWGESTVPKNITIQDCLFDNTGHSVNYYGNTTYAPIAIQGLGDLSGELAGVSEDGLPCRDINIIGNKFTNTNNNYCITMTAAQGITIKDNIFEMRKSSYDLEAGKAIYIKGCMNIEVSGNTYINGSGIKNSIDGETYKNLHGSDVDGKVNKNSCGLEHTWTVTDSTHSIEGCELCGTLELTNAPHKYVAKTVNGEHKYVCMCGHVSSEIPECERFDEIIADGDHYYVCRECGKRSEESAHKEEYQERRNSDGSITYYLGCKCGYGEKGEFTVPASDNFFMRLDTMDYYNGNGTVLTRYMYDAEAGVLYNHITSTDGTHINITGGNGGGIATGAEYEPGRYLVIKYRVNLGTGTLHFRLGYAGEDNGSGSDGNENVTWAKTASRTFANQPKSWRVEVLDLSEITTWPMATSPVYIMLYPASAINIDIAYVATADSFAEISELVTDDTWYFCGTSWASMGYAVDGETGYCVNESSHVYAEVSEYGNHCMRCSYCGKASSEDIHEYDQATVITNADGSKSHAYACWCGAISSDSAPTCTNFDEIIENGDHYYKCSECGKRSEESAHGSDAYQIIENSDGSVTYGYGCKCGYNLKGAITVPANVNYFANLQTMGYYNNGGTLTKYHYDAKAGVLYNRLNSSQTYLNINGGDAVGSFTEDACELGRYLVVKYRTYDKGMIYLHPGSEAHRNETSCAVEDYRGDATIGHNSSEEWLVAVVDLSRVAMYGQDPVVVSKIYMMFLADFADVAYVAVVDSLNEMRGFVTDETYAYYGTNFSNTPAIKYRENDVCLTHAYNGEGILSRPLEGGTEYYKLCFCGEEIETDFVPDITQFITSLDTMTSTYGTVEKNQYDEENNVSYNHYIGNAPTSTITVTGAESGKAYTGKYLMIKYRGDIGTGSVGMKINGKYFVEPTQDFEISNGWKVAIVNLEKIIPELAETASEITIDITIWANGDCTFDLAYVAVTDNLDYVYILVGEDDCTYYGFGSFGESDEWTGPEI